MRRAWPIALLALMLAGCGGEQTVSPLPQTVQGSVPTGQSTSTSGSASGTSSTGGAGAASGKALFAANGCSACHTFKAAGAAGKIGPNLDKLATYAKQAKQPLDAFVRESIVKPNAYIQPGYPPNVMPTFASLSKAQLDALVKFLTSKH